MPARKKGDWPAKKGGVNASQSEEGCGSHFVRVKASQKHLYLAVVAILWE